GKIIGKDKHINGTVNISISAPCNYCHGSDDNFAPPVDLEGKSDTSLVSVGAHQSHIKALNAVSSGVACSECHKVPSDADYPAHLDGDKKAEVTFGTLAKKEGAAPEWTQNSTCKNVYCHGASLDGGSDKEPVWIKVDSSQVKCGSCHGYPPVANNHPQKTDCGICHDEIADNAGKIAKPEKHINGVLNVAYSGACDACHGSDENFAPPVDLDGKSDTSLVSVGAHQSHLKGLNKISSEVECGECHKVPLTAGESSHIDGDGKAEITFGSLAKKEDSSPQWTQNATCKNVYCHGASLEEGKNKEPLWTKVDSSQVKCDSCHGYPPSGDEHPPQTNCGMCHNGIADASGNILKPALHIDGEIEEPENLQCNSCHGSNDNDAPPKDVSGNTATSFKGVGAHQAHLKGSKYGTLVACGECHKVPAETFSGGHVDTPLPAEVAFGTIAKKDNPNAAWDGTKCSNVYCHGSAALGGVLTTPQWTKADGSQSGCGSCHSLPPPLPHLQMSACSDCHASVVKNNLEIIKNGKHINGQIDYN
ncbi:MAG: CxxxxCH/CxxCH domain-containing protein, partial [Deltaproteobacteria bacterium]|nr:CxxxxCH/CxxCH domain-containing protein [Deltaproteobacteria bacterium]